MAVGQVPHGKSGGVDDLRFAPEAKELLILSIDLETELNNIEISIEIKLEILKTLHYISSHLKNDEDAVHWDEKYLKENPKDLIMLTIMTLYYYY